MKVISCHSQRRIFLNEKKRMSNFSLVFDFVVFIIRQFFFLEHTNTKARLLFFSRCNIVTCVGGFVFSRQAILSSMEQMNDARA